MFTCVYVWKGMCIQRVILGLSLKFIVYYTSFSVVVFVYFWPLSPFFRCEWAAKCGPWVYNHLSFNSGFSILQLCEQGQFMALQFPSPRRGENTVLNSQCYYKSKWVNARRAFRTMIVTRASGQKVGEGWVASSSDKLFSSFWDILESPFRNLADSTNPVCKPTRHE